MLLLRSTNLCLLECGRGRHIWYPLRGISYPHNVEMERSVKVSALQQTSVTLTSVTVSIPTAATVTEVDCTLYLHARGNKFFGSNNCYHFQGNL